MTTKQLGFKAPLALAVADGATTPNPGVVGVSIWSTTTGSSLRWNGTSWVDTPIGTTTVINCRAASTANVASLGTTTAQDGVTFATGNLSLIKNQSTASQNGVYTYNGTGLVRASIMAAGAVASPGLMVTVSEGTLNIDTLWMMTADGVPVVGTDALAFKTFAAPAAAGVTLGVVMAIAQGAYSI